MVMPGRKYLAAGGLYRYSINGQEKEKELNENITSAEYWMYDSRIVRRWNTDPIVKDDESPYMTFGNNPIVMIDPDGSDWYKNKKSGAYDWFEGSGRQEGYKHMKTGTWSARNANNISYYFGNSKDGLIMDSGNLLPEVVVTAKGKARNTLADRAFGWANFDRAVAKKWQNNLWDYQSLRNQGISAEDAGAKYEGLGTTYERYYQAEQDYRKMQVAVFIDLPLMFVPVPKVGMLRWIRPFGNAAGRVFWSGAGEGIKSAAFAEATTHAFLYGGTTLERTLVGKSITSIQYVTGRNAMTGKLWTSASSNFAKGAVGEVHAFLAPGLRDGAFWFTEKSYLGANKAVTNIVTHTIK
jgi:hypothetical protein